MFSILWQDEKSLNDLGRALMWLALVVLGFVALWGLRQLPWFDVKHVVVESNRSTTLRYVYSKQIEGVLRQSKGGNIFAIDLQEIRLLTMKLPWVRQTTVRRVWPNTLLIKIEEHQPLARWGAGALVNDQGELFFASSAQAEEDGELPELIGPDGSEKIVSGRFIDINQWIKPTKLRVRRLELSERYAWDAVLNNGLVMKLGQERKEGWLQTRVKRFVQSYPSVLRKWGRDIVVVDLRYSNGYAVTAKNLKFISENAPTRTEGAGSDDLGVAKR